MSREISAKVQPSSVLLGSSDVRLIDQVCRIIEAQGSSVTAVRSSRAFLAQMRENVHDLLLLDAHLEDGPTPAVMGAIRPTREDVAVLVFSESVEQDSVITLIRQGACDVLRKPLSDEELLVRIVMHLELAVRRQSKPAVNVAGSECPLGDSVFISSAPVMRDVVALTGIACRVATSVLITGETGTGKNVVARVIHAGSKRCKAPFVEVNLGGLTPGLFESEVFGHVKGAFTGADKERRGRFFMADKGTIFLDEVATIPTSLQAKLLHVVEAREVEQVGSDVPVRFDARIISATNADLNEEVISQRFRQDLLFRLNGLEIHLPPLRERREDIPLLIDHFLRLHSATYERPKASFTAAAMDALVAYSWPGNIRELKHVVERAVLTAQSRQIGIDGTISAGCSKNRPNSVSADLRTDELNLANMELRYINEALRRFGGNIQKAAQVLGVSRSLIYRRLQERPEQLTIIRHGLTAAGDVS